MSSLAKLHGISILGDSTVVFAKPSLTYVKTEQ